MYAGFAYMSCAMFLFRKGSGAQEKIHVVRWTVLVGEVPFD